MATRAPYRVTFAVITAAVASFTMLQGLVVPLLTEIQQKFDTSQTTASWALTSYLISASVCTPLAGRIGDILGKQRVMIALLVILSIGCLAAALAPTIEVLIASRVVQGSGGGLIALAFGIIRDEFPRARLGGAVSMIAALTGAGYSLGIVAAGPILEALGFSWLFWIPMVLSMAAAIALVVISTGDPVRTPARLSILPAVLLAGWLVCLLLAISDGRQWGWTSPAVLGLCVAALVLCLAWAWSEHRAAAPVIDLALLRIRGVWTTNILVFCIGFGVFGYFAFLPGFVSTDPVNGYGFGASVSEAGRYLLPATVLAFVSALRVALLIRSLGARAVIFAGAMLLAASFGLLAVFHEHTWQVLLFTSIQGVGSGLTFSALAGVVLVSVPAQQTGVASGMNTNIRTIGGAAGTAIAAAIVTAHAGPDLVPSEAGYTTAFAVLAGMLVVASVVALWIPGNGSGRLGRVLRRGADNEAGLAAVPTTGAV